MADSLFCSLEGRSFQALLNGLSKKLFFNDKNVTYDYLMEHLFAEKDLEPDEIMAQIRIFEKLLQRAAQKNWDISKLESLLTSSDIDSTNSRILLQFWNNERDKIHNSLAKATTFNNHLTDFSWRVDVKTASKSSPEINLPIAVVEFGLQSGYKDNSANNTSTASTSTVRFGMDRDDVAAMIDELEKVQKAVDNVIS